MLEPLGVDPLGDAVYSALLEMRSANVDTIARRTAAPVEAVVDALRTLRAIELVDEEEPGVWYAHPPAAALDAALAREARLIRERQRELERLDANVGSFISALRRRDAATQEIVEVVSDPNAAAVRCIQQVRRATEEVLSLDGPSYGGPVGHRYQVEVEPIEMGLIARGVRFRAVYENAVLDDPDHIGAVHEMVARGEDARVLPSLPMKLLIVDRKFAALPIEPNAVNLGAVFVLRSALLSALVALFESLWVRAAPVPAPGAAQAETDEDTRLLAMLAAGCKDETIARQLGVSQSTVTRRVARLLGRLDASSRFQAGAQAVRRALI